MPAVPSVTARVPAKINLSLDVGPVRGDGFHPLRTVYQAVGLHDEVTVTAAGSLSLTVHGASADLGPDSGNLAVRAVTALAEAASREPRVAIEVRKQIPVAAGMAGGSADAAGALLATAVLWGLLDDPTSPGAARVDLFEIAATLGSDVPFLLTGGTALGTGRGELVEALPDGPTLSWVVVEIGARLSTPSVYRELDRLRAAAELPTGLVESTGAVPAGATARVLVAMGLVERPWTPRPGARRDEWLPGPGDPAREADNARRLAAATGNDLQPATVSLLPALGEVLDLGRAAGADAVLVSGSGPTVLLAGSDPAALAAAVAEHPLVRATHTADGPVRPHVWTL